MCTIEKFHVEHAEHPVQHDDRRRMGRALQSHLRVRQRLLEDRHFSISWRRVNHHHYYHYYYYRSLQNGIHFGWRHSSWRQMSTSPSTLKVVGFDQFLIFSMNVNSMQYSVHHHFLKMIYNCITIRNS